MPIIIIIRRLFLEGLMWRLWRKIESKFLKDARRKYSKKLAVNCLGNKHEIFIINITSLFIIYELGNLLIFF